MKILISSCLIGKKARWHGRKTSSQEALNFLKKHPEAQVIDICPEILGGLPCPRLPVKRVKGRIFETVPDKKKRKFYTGREVMAFFEAGAKKSLEIALREKPDICLLCKWSPSCDKMGVTGTLLEKHGFKIVNIF